MRHTSTKTAVVRYLEENSGHPVSGATIAEELGISRTAVWKAIKALEAEGYQIDATTGQGYTLRRENDVVSVAGILKYLGSTQPFFVYDTVTSTNDVLREKAAGGAPEGTAVVATTQTAGKGRRGRSFYSPEGTGIYFSFLLRPSASEDTGFVTIMAAVAVAEVLEECGEKDVGIKWVNDVYVAGRKVCGILSEAVTDMETGLIEEIIVGIGINIHTPKEGFPADIAERAGSLPNLQKEADMRNRLVACVYRRFFDLYRQTAGTGDYSQLAERYREKCFVPGKSITVLRGNQERKALALGLDDDCHLMVRYENGQEETLFSGEISIALEP